MNLETKQYWNDKRWIFELLLVAIISSLLLDKCNNSEIGITIPEKKGTFESVKPKNIPISKIEIHTNVLSKKSEKEITNTDSGCKKRDSEYEKQLISSLLIENDKLKNDFNTLSDSIKKEMYYKSIELNKFSQTFDNADVRIDVSGIARGTVESIKADYTIKEQKIKAKQRVFALKTGAEYGNTTRLDKSCLKANLEAELKNGKSFSIGYDSDGRYWLGMKVTLFQINK